MLKNLIYEVNQLIFIYYMCVFLLCSPIQYTQSRIGWYQGNEEQANGSAENREVEAGDEG